MNLSDELRARIARDGPLTVRDFMQAALHDPVGGYYAKGPDIGAAGDFYTSANASLFAPALARFVRDAQARLPSARVVELGGGTGAFAEALGTPVTIVEPNEGMAAQQRARGIDVVSSLSQLTPAPTIYLANEVLDALPVHRLVMTSDGLREGYVALRDGAFVEVPGPVSVAELADAAARLSPLMAEGCFVEVALDARDLLSEMARAGPESIALFLDYGGAPEELYGDTKPQGTLRGYREHKPTSPFEHPADQDITADVDFRFIESVAAEAGYQKLGYRQQGELLADLGLLDDLMAALQRGDTGAYLSGKNLLMPGGMGERFKAIALGRGVTPESPLAGFRPLGGFR